MERNRKSPDSNLIEEIRNLDINNLIAKETKHRQGIEIYYVRTNREIHKHLIMRILPGYLILLLVSLIYGIITGNSEYFNGILNFVTPLLVTVYGFFFWKDTKAK